jgi:hypothetical protein
MFLKFSPLLSGDSGFVQSGFYEVAITTALQAPLCHATSQNPQDSDIRHRTGSSVTFSHSRAEQLGRWLPKNADVPKSPLPQIGSLGAVGWHDFYFEIDGWDRRCRGIRDHS